MRTWGRLVAFVLTLSCALASPGGAAEKADRIFVNGRLWTGEKTKPWAEALAIRGTTILAVGSTAEIKRRAEKATDVVDLKGRFACPGFGDAHVGLMSGSLALDQVDLAGAGTLDEVRARISRYAKANPEAPWVVGRGWSYAAFPGGLPDKAVLDVLVSDRPAFLVSYDGHTGWANSPALIAAGITRSAKDPPGGAFVRDAGGEPTGALKEEAAMAPVRRLIPPPAPDQKARALKKGLDLAAAQGLTAVHDLALNADDVEVFALVAGERPLKVTVFSALPLPREPTPEAMRGLAELRAKARVSRWRIGAVMGFVDGVVESRTAAFFEPYPGGKELGLLGWAEEALDRAVAAIDKLGLQVALHAVGDRAVHVALNAVERAARANGTSGRRHRIEHLELVRPQDLARFASLGVVASTQPPFATPDRNHFEAYLPALGPERGARALAFKSIDDAGAAQAFGSNWPVCSLSVLRGIHAAVTRTTAEGTPAGGWEPSQRVSVEAALRHYTRDVAFASFEEGSRGTLAAGKQADLVVLSEDITAGPPERLLAAKVLLTVLGGQDTYRAKEF
ncbi:MAG TPA: amidohydrolase [Vicinamibacteria bacterium]|nr:amidohydrolase [Vicinamibacteria bacterium]